MDSPLVSVVIPNYNNAHYLKECIDSVLSQTYLNIEIIVVDDASTDNSRSIIKEISKVNENVKFYFKPNNGGVSSARNDGICRAKGKYITTLDSDDTYVSEKIEKEVELAESFFPEKVIVFSGVNLVNNNMNKIREVVSDYKLAQGDVFYPILFRLNAIPRDMLIPRDIITRDFLFDESMSLYEDWDFKLKLAKKFKFFYSGVEGVNYRQVDTGLSSVRALKHREAMKVVFGRHSKKQAYYFLFYLCNHLRFASRGIRFFCRGLKW